MTIDTYNSQLGTKIKVLRDLLGFSQEKLAGLLGVKRVTLSQIENGERKLTAEELSRLSKIFNVPTDVLLDLQSDIEVSLSQEHELLVENQIRISVPQKNIAKFREALLYILNKVGSKPNIGETVIYKLLYFIDFDYYEKYEEQFIGATYQRNHYGPTPVEFKKIIKQMLDKDLVKITDKYFEYPMTKYLPLRPADLGKLNGREIKTIDDVLDKLSDMNASQISEYSHNDVPWLTTDNGKIIDYEKVFYRTLPYSVRSGDDESVR